MLGHLEKLVIWRPGWPYGTGTLGRRRRGQRRQTGSSQTGRPGPQTTDSREPGRENHYQVNFLEDNAM